MGDKSKIEWTDATWNPVSGCTKVSQGCKHCYAERVFPRVYAKEEREFTDIKLHPDRLDLPLRWKKPRRIFVNSMSDLFHEKVPDGFIDKIFAVMADAEQHKFQILTKRPGRMQWYLSGDNPRYSARKVFDLSRGAAGKFDCDIYWPLSNVHIGVSCEDQPTADERIPLLLETPAEVRFVSLEPLLGSIDLSEWLRNGIPTQDQIEGSNGAHYVRHGSSRIDWVIVGGESGPHARPTHPDWVRSIRDQCQAAGVPFFFKQWGEWVSVSEVEGPGAHFHFSDGATVRRVGKKAAGATLDGREWREYPR